MASEVPIATVASEVEPGGPDGHARSSPSGSGALESRDRSASGRRNGRERWLEFILVGGASLVLLPVCWLARQVLGLDTAELVVGFLTFHAAAVINDPHFSVTYLLFYRDFRGRALGGRFHGAQLARYWAAGVVAPLLLAGWALTCIATESSTGLGWMIQLMFLLVGWHYVKQAFGVLMFTSADLGAKWSTGERRVLLLHCYAAWAYAWSTPAMPATPKLVHGVFYTSIAQAQWLSQVSFAVFWATVAGLLWMLGRRLIRGKRLPVLALVAFASSVWLWSVFTRLDPVFYYCIPALHSVQYLFFVHRMARGEACRLAGPPHFQGTVATRLGLLTVSAVGLGWLLLHVAPAVLDEAFASGAPVDLEKVRLGSTPYLAAFTTFVNLHHYFMDWVIWRRDNPLTAYLQRS